MGLLQPKTILTKESRATLAALVPAGDDFQRLQFAAHAARVKRDLLIRRAHRQGANLRQIGEAAGIGKDTVARIVEQPEPKLHERPKREPWKHTA